MFPPWCHLGLHSHNFVNKPRPQENDRLLQKWWRHQIETFSRYWLFVRGIHRSPVNSLHKGQWREALMFSMISAWINRWVNNRQAGDLRRYWFTCLGEIDWKHWVRWYLDIYVSPSLSELRRLLLIEYEVNSNFSSQLHDSKLITRRPWQVISHAWRSYDFDVLVQERRNSSALAKKLHIKSFWA